MTKSSKIIRNSNIELLRIFSILIIILNHYSLYGGFYESFTYDEIHLNQILLQWFHIGGKLGVDIFLFISGFFYVH